MSRITISNIYTEVPDDLAEKGLDVSTGFTVRASSIHPPLDNKIGTFYLEPMPGCCGIVVSTRSFLETNFRGNPYGDLFHQLKAAVAKHAGYSTMLMTTQLRNIPEVVGASKARWKFFHYFRNKRTDNDIGIAFKDL